jgi:hypothetical protein
LLLVLTLGPPLAAQNDFLRGDVDCDGAVTLVDPYKLLQIQFSGLIAPCDCLQAWDADCSGASDAADSVYLFNHLVLGGAAPCAPYPAYGPGVAGGLSCTGYPTGPLFKRGDANQDGCVSSDDASLIMDYLFGFALPPSCLQAADANDDDAVTNDDAVYILAYCSGVGPAPPAPGPLTGGEDPTAGALTCGSYPASACASGCTNQRQGDANQDGTLDISDPVEMLAALFSSTAGPLPCGDGSVVHPSNVRLMSVNGNFTFDISDPIYLLAFLFNGGPAPAAGVGCTYIEECPQNVKCATCTP